MSIDRITGGTPFDRNLLNRGAMGESGASIHTTDSVQISRGEKPLNLLPDLRGMFKAAPVEEKKTTVQVQNMYITLSGSPGAGKSTHGRRLSERYGIPHISVGKILRKEVASGSELGMKVKPFVESGDLAPADLVTAVVTNRLSQPDCRNGFILDGYPRKESDLEAFQGITEKLGIKNFRMICIEVPPEVVIDRMKNRRVCDNGHEYDLVQNPPKKQGFCDVDNLPIHQRDDDRPETIRHRFDVFRQETMPVINHYRAQGNFEHVDGNGTIEEVGSRLASLLDPKEEPGAINKKS